MTKTLYESKIWVADLDEILDTIFEIKNLENKTILITGGTGLICSAVIDLLIHYNETHVSKINIIVGGRSLDKVKKRFGKYVSRDYYHFVEYDSTWGEFNLAESCDYIIHGASNAYASLIVKEPVETMLSNFNGLKNLLNIAKANNVKRVLYISSSEVYGKKDDNLPFKEDEYGYIDFLNARNSYSISKRAAETLCASYASEYNVDSVIVRPGHIYGPTATKKDNRVSSEWVYRAANGEDIIMLSDGSQLRSYCYCLDCASAILKILLSGISMNAYNISNPESIISIMDFAKIAAKAGNIQIIKKAASEETKKGFNPMANSSLNSEKLLSLGWRGLFSARRGIEHTLAILEEILDD